MKKFTKEVNKKFTNSDITVLALFDLGGATNYVHLEDVAIKSASLSPNRFSWERYPEYINLESVRLALKHSLESKDNRVTGGIKCGWMLSPVGVAWIIQNSKFAGAIGKSASKKIENEIHLAKLTAAFAKYKANKVHEISEAELLSLLRIDKYFAKRNYTERVIALNNVSFFNAELAAMMKALGSQGFKQLEVELG